MFSAKFVAASANYCTLTDHTAAPLFRKTFTLSKALTSAHLTVCGLGFYRVFVNGTEITKGFLAPYIANPDDLLYYDRYDISGCLHCSTLGFVLYTIYYCSQALKRSILRTDNRSSYKTSHVLPDQWVVSSYTHLHIRCTGTLLLLHENSLLQ